MADVNANIGVHIDTSDALAQLKNLQRQLSQFHTSVAKSSSVAAAAQKSLQKNLVNSINSIGAFSAELRTVKTTTESFTNSLEKNKFSMREYFRYAGASTKTFGRLFTSELDTISKVAEDRVKKLQTQYIKLGRDSQGAMKAIAIMPNQLDFSKTSTQLQIAAQKQAIFNQLLKQGSTNLLNFGKNTQWAGRQLMVGFTVPLGILGMKASQTFMDMEKAALKFKKVYGDLLTSPEETKAALDGITELGKQYTKYGVAVADTVALSAEAAAAGFQGVDLQRQTAQATRLSVLGQIEAQKALETTIALQNSFKMSSEDLAGSIDFLNAVENQTVTSLDDITTAIPKVAPVIQQLGGDVKDLAFFITAMKEGGINASEGANALKSGLAALINPTAKASAMLANMGININGIVESNKGDLKATVIGFAQALDTLDPLTRARAIEQMFGKFQFARLSTLFQNVTKDGTQAGRVLKLAGTSIADLAAQSEKELGMTAASPMNQFKKAVEDLKLALVPVGETFLKSVTPIVEFFGNILEKFSGLSDNTKKIITIITIAVAGVGPVLLMTFGLLANGIANIIKLFATLRNGYLKLTGQSTVLGEQTQYMTDEQLDAAAAAHSLNQSHATLKQTFDVEKASLDKLIASYQSGAKAARAFAASNPGAMLPIPSGKKPKKFAIGKPYVVGGSGNRDSEPAMLAPGETVIPAKMSKKYGKLINGMIAGNIPGYETGKSIGKKVILPGGMDVSHFGAKKQMSGADLLSLFDDADPAIKAKVQDLVNKFKDGSQRMFTVFDNQVVALFADVNRDLDKKGKVSKARLRENLLGEKFAPVRDIELQRQFENAGKSPEEFAKANKQLTEAIQKGFARLGDVVDVTEEQVNDLIETAYKEVSETNKDVAAAHKKMKQVSTVTEPDVGGVRGKRVALSKESYVTNKKGSKSYKNRMTSLVGAKNIPYNFNSEFNISNEMLKRLGMTGDQAAAAFKKMSAQAQLGLAQLKGSTDAFVKQFEIEAKKIGIAYSTAVKQSGVDDIYVESRDRNSPHELAPKDGRDDAIAYDNARNQQLTQSAKQRRAAERAQGPAGIGLDAPEGTSFLPIVSQPTKSDLRKTAVRDRFRSVKGKVAESMSGARGIGVSSGLMMASQFVPGKAGEIAGQASSVLFAAQALKMLPGQLKIAGAALLGFTVLYTKLLARQNEQKAVFKATFEPAKLLITRLGDTAIDTTLKITGIADGVKNLKDSILGADPAVTALVEEIKKLPEDDSLSKFINNISDSGLKTASLIGSLRSQVTSAISTGGLSPENAKKYVEALLVAANKTKDFNEVWKAISKNTLTAEEATETYLNKLSQAIDIEKNYTNLYVVNPHVETYLKSYDELPAAAQTAAEGLKNLFAITSNGSLTLKESEKRINALKDSALNGKLGIDLLGVAIRNSGDKAAIDRFDTIKQLYTDAGKAAKISAAEIFAANQVLQLTTQESARAWASDKGYRKISPFEILIKYSKSPEFKEAQKVLNELLNPPPIKTPTTTTTTTEDKFNFLDYSQKAFQAAKAQAVAFQKLKDAGFEAAFAMELVGNADLAAAVAAGGLTDEIKKQLLLMKGRQDELSKYQKQIEEASKTEGDREKERLAKLEARFNLEEEIAKLKFSSKIEKENENLRNQQYELELVNRKIEAQAKALAALVDPKQNRIDDISYQLEGISFKEDAINEKYDRQSELLSTITQMNQDLYSIQKRRISLADALSSGDISAAASIIMDMRAEQASIQATSQQDVLDAAREQELNALGRVALERESKKLQYEILTIQRNQSKEQENLAKVIEENINSVQNYIADMEEELADEIASVNNRISKSVGMTKTQIQSAMSMIDLANAAGFNMNNKTLITNILQAAVDKANELSKILGSLPTTGTGTGDGTDTGSGDTLTPKVGDRKYIGSTLMEWDGTKWKDVNTSSPVIPADPRNAPGSNVETPKVGDSKYIGSMLMTWDGTKWVEAATYKPAPVQQPANLPETVYTPDTYVPSSGYVPPAVVFPTQPATTIPTGPSTDTNASQDEINRERGAYQNTATVTTAVVVGNFTESSLAAKLKNIPIGFSSGGIVPKYFAKGGFSRGTDTIPAMLTPGEFVVNRRAAAGLGVNNLNAMNSGQLPSGSVYNYKVDVTLNGSDMNPNDVANAVLTKIKQLESRNVRRQGI